MTKPDNGFLPSLRTFPVVVGVIAAMLGILVLAGWFLDVPALKSVLPGFATMKANTALGIATLGISLLLTQYGVSAGRLGKVMAAMIAALGAVTLLEYILGWDAGIDQLLFAEPQTPANIYPGRPSHATAFNLMILGIALLCVFHTYGLA